MRLRAVVISLSGVVLLSAGCMNPVSRTGFSIDDTHRYILKNGRPFFYLADTGWELFLRLDRAEADHYLETRAAQGFTVIMAMVIGFRPGEDDRNVYGEAPLVDKDPLRPNEQYFQHVDYVVNKANALGLAVALVPSWSDWMYDNVGKWPHPFNAENARIYGRYVGQRYAEKDIFWILGGDRDPDGYLDILHAMAEGLDEGDGSHDRLMTFHGGKTTTLLPPDSVYYERLCSTYYFRLAPWLDIYGTYSGHQWAYPTHRLTAFDRTFDPPRPVLEVEPCYENHPYFRDGSRYWTHPRDWSENDARGTAAMIREQAWWAMLAGAAGHTFGNNDVWQFYDGKREPYGHANTHWREALESAGAVQMGIMRRLFESRPWTAMVPDNEIITAGQGVGEDHIQTARDAGGRFLFVYVPRGTAFTVDLEKMTGSEAKGYWFNPRNGEAASIGSFRCTGQREFTPPSSGEDNDWVLVLDDAGQRFPPIGRQQ